MLGLATNPDHTQIVKVHKMLSLTTLASSPRYANVATEKATGATYTPVSLARFVAHQILQIAHIPPQGKIRLLDPAVGNGILLEAVLDAIPETNRPRVVVFGFDTQQTALNQARNRLENKYPNIELHLEQRDFLAFVAQWGQQHDLFSTTTQPQTFDLVIANPPYVRTQIIGADQAQRLAKQFGLTGRVDLYYPFLLGLSRVLAPQGTAGIITSNRFMTTKAGQTVRQAVLSCFNIAQIWDLGDTKLFDAAVLPAVLVTTAAEKSSSNHKNIRFSSIYATKEPATTASTDILQALLNPNDSKVSIPDGRCFHVKHGTLDTNSDPTGIWRVASSSTDTWLETVVAQTWGTFGDIGKIRVGVKTTADKVFIRHDWEQLSSGIPELLRPLMTRHWSHPFKAVKPAKANYIKQILYPHETQQGKRQVVDLNRYPKAKKYLEAHRSVLSARTYISEAGRQWYEIWVPQNPEAWVSPKLVFPDIAEKPTFWLDIEGSVVSGECYWLRCENGTDENLLWLALAVANSSFIEAFYDHRFNNKLYAGRRRFITQYVEKFPLPNPARAESQAIINLAKRIYAILPSPQASTLITELDSKIWQVFGLSAEKTMR